MAGEALGATQRPESEPWRLTPREHRLAVAAGLGTIAYAALWLIPRPPDLSPPELVPRAVVLGILFATPGVIAFVGACRGQRPLLVAAGVLCFGQSIVSFSGLTLVFLLPALVLLAVAAEPRAGSRVVRWSLPRVALGILFGVPVVILALFPGGLFIPLALVVVAALARARAARPEERPPVSRPGSAVGVLVIALVVLAWTAVLATTETTCWVARETADGLVYQRAPIDDGAIALPPDVVASGCDGGQLTLTGAAVAFVLVAGAIVASIALPPSRPAD